MSRFRRVEGEQAGPNALGVLVPPGRRTTIILRPRALDWDLLPVHWDDRGEPGTTIQELISDQAAQIAQRLVRNLEESKAGDASYVIAAPAAPGDGFWVRAEVSALPMIVCRRNPGEPYQANAFPTLDAAESVARQVAAVLFPEAGANQELYVNRRNFAR